MNNNKDTKESNHKDYLQIRLMNGIRISRFSFQLPSNVDLFLLFFFTELAHLLASTPLPQTFFEFSSSFPLPSHSVFDLHPSWASFLCSCLHFPWLPHASSYFLEVHRIPNLPLPVCLHLSIHFEKWRQAVPSCPDLLRPSCCFLLRQKLLVAQLLSLPCSFAPELSPRFLS